MGGAQPNETSWGGLTAALGVLGLLVAAAARIAYEEYYRTLGVTLDEVGLSNARMLTWSAAGVLVFIGWAASTITVAERAYRATPERFKSWDMLLAHLLATAIALLHAAVLALWTPWFYALVVLGLVGLALPFIRPGAWAWLRSTTRVGAGVAYGVLVLILLATIHRAGNAALDLDAAGDEGDSFPAVVLDIAAQPVCVQSSSLQGARLLLGSANGTVVLYDAVTRQATRLPVSSVWRIDTLRRGGSCAERDYPAAPVA